MAAKPKPETTTTNLERMMPPEYGHLLMASHKVELVNGNKLNCGRGQDGMNLQPIVSCGDEAKKFR
jgi:hypothetical protein